MQLSVNMLYILKNILEIGKREFGMRKGNIEMGMLKDERLKDENHTTSLTADGDELHPVPSGPPSSTRQGQTP
ncbi:hypothetical protein [uncultured Dialister sp.]|jgi:hypothetical protein|uniref:hypothetical protein n=1 Tax=uncultured Dialister sp. TaxID=278064 RepID=UPI0026709207|nr:hypothetical protein [uncultured Dialister sp.]